MNKAKRVLRTPPLSSSVSKSFLVDESDHRESIIKSFDSNNQLGAVNRRKVLMSLIVGTSAATATATLLKNLTTTFAEADPIHSAIETCRYRRRVFDAAHSKDPGIYAEGLAVVLWDAYDSFARTVPTTRAGIMAKLVFIDEVTEHTPDAFDDEVVSGTLITAAKRLTRS